MKKILLILVLGFTFISCKKLTEFSVSDSSEFTIPSTASLGIPINDTTSVASTSSVQFKANGADIKNVKEIRLSRLTLSVIDPPDKTFSFLNSIHIYILADGLPEAEIAYLENISANVGSAIDLVTTGAVLDDYIKKDNYYLRFKTVTDELLVEDRKIRADMTFRVRAKVL